LKTTTLLAKRGIGSKIPIRVTHYTLSLDFENALLPKSDIISMMPFLRSFSLDFEMGCCQNLASVH
jgi:hypothetical protein